MDVRIRRAGPADVDEVTDVLIASMPGDADWWDYRFPGRLEYPEDHRRFLSLLVRAWIEHPRDYAVMVAECPCDAGDPDDRAPPGRRGDGAHRIGSYSAWDTTYLGEREQGPSYQGVSPGQILAAAGAAQRRDTTAARAQAHSQADARGIAEFLEVAPGVAGPHAGEHEYLHLQALGTHPAFGRRGLASALCRWGLETARADGVAAVTVMASPGARRLYRRLGFGELGSVAVRVPGEDGPGTCLHAMAMAVDP